MVSNSKKGPYKTKSCKENKRIKKTSSKNKESPENIKTESLPQPLQIHCDRLYKTLAKTTKNTSENQQIKIKGIPKTSIDYCDPFFKRQLRRNKKILEDNLAKEAVRNKENAEEIKIRSPPKSCDNNCDILHKSSPKTTKIGLENKFAKEPARNQCHPEPLNIKCNPTFCDNLCDHVYKTSPKTPKSTLESKWAEDLIASWNKYQSKNANSKTIGCDRNDREEQIQLNKLIGSVISIATGDLEKLFTEYFSCFRDLVTEMIFDARAKTRQMHVMFAKLDQGLEDRQIWL